MAVRQQDLLRKLNTVIQEIIEEWAAEQNINIKHDGVIVTVVECPDSAGNMRVRIDWPFTYGF